MIMYGRALANFNPGSKMFSINGIDDSKPSYLSFGEVQSSGSYFFCQCELAPKPVLLRQILGDRASRRLEELKEAKSGWNFGEGEPLGALAISACINLFSSIGSFPFKKDLRLYLANDGGLNLVWENNKGSTLMIKCLRDKYIVVDDKANLEESFPLSDARTALVTAGLLSTSFS